LVHTEPIIQMILGRFRGGMSGVLKLLLVSGPHVVPKLTAFLVAEIE